MIISVSGYNASGKSTLAEYLVTVLDACEQRNRVLKFDSVYLSKWLTRKRNRSAQPDYSGNLGLREIEGQRGNWDRPFGFRQFIDILCASLSVWVVRLLNFRRVVIFDRYFYDRFVHFRPDGVLYRAAYALFPNADLAFVLIPEKSEWERRLLNRVQQRFGLTLSRLSDKDRQELDGVQERYERFLHRDPRLRRVDSARRDGCEYAGQLVAACFRNGLPLNGTQIDARIANSHSTAEGNSVTLPYHPNSQERSPGPI